MAPWLWVKVKNDHRSKFANLSSWKEEAWKKNQGFNGIWSCNLRDTGAMLYQLSYEATLWDRGQLVEFISHEEWKMLSIYEIIYICTAVVDKSTFIYNRSISYILHILVISITRHAGVPG